MHSSADLAPLAPGTRLGNYEIVRMLRLGGMGELYLARRVGIEGFEKQVALKRILAQFATDPTFEDMLLDEARLMATLEHPNIVQVFDIDRVRGSTFFTMEYVQGENLRGVLKESARRKKGLSRGNALWVVMNVAAGLHYAHEKRRPDGTHMAMIHRDVSPSNIMISRAGGVKLVDFGIAMAIARSAKTTPGAIKGNIRYMSPEQSVGGPLDRRSDIFSLGIVLFELTTGTRWMRETDDYLAVQQMLNEPLPRPTDRKPNYPPELEAIVMQAVARNPADRFATAEEFQIALEEYIRENRVLASSVTMARTMSELFPAGEALQMTRPPLTEPMGDQDRATIQRASGPVVPLGKTLPLPEPAPFPEHADPTKTLPIPSPTASQAPLDPKMTLPLPDPDGPFAPLYPSKTLPLPGPHEPPSSGPGSSNVEASERGDPHRGQSHEQQTLVLGIVPAGAKVDETLPLPEPEPTPLEVAGVSQSPPSVLVALGVGVVLAALGSWWWMSTGSGSDKEDEAPPLPTARVTTAQPAAAQVPEVATAKAP